MADSAGRTTSGGNGRQALSYGPGPEATGPPPTGIPGLVNEAMDVIDSFIEYVSGLARLQVFRVRATARSIVIRAGVLLAAGVILLIGLVLFSGGVAAWLATVLGSLWAALLVVGGAWILIAVIAAVIGMTARFGAVRRAD